MCNQSLKPARNLAAGTVLGAGLVTNGDSDVVLAESRASRGTVDAEESSRDDTLALLGGLGDGQLDLEVVNLVGLGCFMC